MLRHVASDEVKFPQWPLRIMSYFLLLWYCYISPQCLLSMSEAESSQRQEMLYWGERVDYIQQYRWQQEGRVQRRRRMRWELLWNVLNWLNCGMCYYYSFMQMSVSLSSIEEVLHFSTIPSLIQYTSLFCSPFNNTVSSVIQNLSHPGLSNDVLLTLTFQSLHVQQNRDMTVGHCSGFFENSTKRSDVRPFFILLDIIFFLNSIDYY